THRCDLGAGVFAPRGGSVSVRPRIHASARLGAARTITPALHPNRPLNVPATRMPKPAPASSPPRMNPYIRDRSERGKESPVSDARDTSNIRNETDSPLTACATAHPTMLTLSIRTRFSRSTRCPTGTGRHRADDRRHGDEQTDRRRRSDPQRVATPDAFARTAL